MAPKRKRDDEPVDTSTPTMTRATRRSTRNSAKSTEDSTVEGSSSNAPTAKTKAKKAGAPKKTSPGDEEEEAPAPKKTRTTAKGKSAGKASTGKKSSTTSTSEFAALLLVFFSVVQQADLPLWEVRSVESEDKLPTTSANPNGAKAPAASTAVSKAELYTPDKALTLFNQYADETDPEVIGPEGLERLCNDADISMEGVLPLLLAWQLSAKEMGKFSKDEWVKGTANLKISSPKILRLALSDLEDLLILDKPPLKPSKSEPYSRTSYWEYSRDKKKAFHEFYSFCFTLAKAEQSRNIDMEIVTALWSVLLAPKFPIMTEVISFINERGAYKAANKDLWVMMLAFCESVKPTLENYDESGGAWPTLLDDFVESKKSEVALSS
ncbi:hypothetical protein V5O48_004621 [Marasmius crinis-equi]|uniref:Defective in cullin neddylation protein n=1 Tax=Marasmius crinis-equi TaxID=585013 RepID=A0ABR3FPM7_9AGAR